MSGETTMTLVGNLTADPELRYTQGQVAVANFTLACTEKKWNKDTGKMEDGDSMFIRCNVWREAAENLSSSLVKGMRVIVTGRLKQRSFETKEGEKRTTFEIEVDEAGPSLRWAKATVSRSQGAGTVVPVPAEWNEVPADQDAPF